MGTLPPRLNQDIDWDLFNADTYRQHYFINLGQEDLWLLRQLIEYIASHQLQSNSLAVAVDVGTGPNIIAPLVVSAIAKKVEIVEPGAQNIAYLQSILKEPARLQKDWGAIATFIANNPQALPEHQEVLRLFAARAILRKKLIADLCANSYDFLTSTFCGESVTSSLEECAEFIGTMYRAVKPGGHFVVGFVEGSAGYPDYAPESIHNNRVDMLRFPAAQITEVWLKKQFANTNITVTRCPLKPTIREGYTGVLLASGVKI